MPTNSDLPYNFLKEQVIRANKYVYLNETFIPDFKFVPPTPKFYSKYETGESINLTPEKFADNIKLIDENLKSLPHDIYKEPITESQEIGWTPGPMFKYDGIDMELFYYPRKKNDITKVGELIAKNGITERSKFNGIPFQLT